MSQPAPGPARAADASSSPVHRRPEGRRGELAHPRGEVLLGPKAEGRVAARRVGEDVSDVTEAMWISKDEGYASFIQPKYITECSCESTAERAEGVVTFKHDLFAGRIPFVAQATKDGWIITEFRLPQYKTRVVCGKDGVWSQEALPGK